MESERMVFISRLLGGEGMTDLCREFGISRKTGYKLKTRYELLGASAFADGSRRPHRMPRRTPPAIQEALLEIKAKRPTWGPKKVRDYLALKRPEVKWPAKSTVAELFLRKGLVKGRRRRQVTPLYLEHLRPADRANVVWCGDYKGQFRLGDKRYCYPLTVSDQATRFLLACEGFERINGDAARGVFEELFVKYGLPDAIRTDNGTPFASRGLWGLSRLSVFWLKTGVVHERIEPGHPEQNGRHERMHRTLKEDTTRPPRETLLQQQERFDEFVRIYNEERPHEALGDEPPANHYQLSKRRYVPGAALDYPVHDDVRKVSSCGHINILRKRNTAVFLSTALAGEKVGIRELRDGRWLVSFAHLDLGHADPNTNRFSPNYSNQPLKT